MSHKNDRQGLTRRDFLRGTVAGSAATASVVAGLGVKWRAAEAAKPVTGKDLRYRTLGQTKIGASELGTATVKIREARQSALDILRPSQRDLEYGLGLHRESLVIDAYGFAPTAAVDGGTLKAAVEQGASEAELHDLEEDMRMTRCVADPREREEFVAAWEAAGVTCILQNAGEEGASPLRLLKRLAHFTYLTDMLQTFVFKAASPEDIVGAKSQSRRCLYFEANGIPLSQQWVSVEEELSYIRIFFQLGIRMMHLTYNRRNMLGEGCAEPANAGLSDLGRAAIAEMNRVGVIVDVAHSGWQTSLETAKASERPIVASHSACAALNPHYRCKPDAVLRALADAGGYLGICCISGFLGGTGEISAMLDHVGHVVANFGADYVAIGTDVGYESSAASEQNRLIPQRRRARPGFESLWPPSGRPEPDQKLSLAWTNWPLFTVGLVQRGYSDRDIQKILGGNVLRVAREVLRTSALRTDSSKTDAESTPPN